jgi:glycosyltransferase involved in cell wall biosynthesis
VVRVLLINQDKIPHYRVPVYGYLSRYLGDYGFSLIVVASGIEEGNPHSIEFEFEEFPLSLKNLLFWIIRHKIDIIILWVNLKNIYLLPICIIAKLLLDKKIVYWGHGKDLANKDAKVKNIAYAIQQYLSDAIIIYAEHLRGYVPQIFHKKVFIANNTLCINYRGLECDRREKVLAQYGIWTEKNIICVGRIQKRKRLENLIAAHAYMNRPDVGLIIVGPDVDGILNKYNGPNIYKLGKIVNNDKFDLLSCADIYCIPGAIGLSIVDAFYCGLPLVTEAGDDSPEIMYLKNGENGFIVPKGNIVEMANKMQVLLDNELLRQQFSENAKLEIAKNGSIDNMCAGFRDSLLYIYDQLQNKNAKSKE